jgi:hypothetical protein
MGYFIHAGDHDHMEAFLYRVIVVCVIRHYDASLRNELQIHNVRKRTVSGCDGNLNFPKCSSVLDTYCEFRNITTGAFCRCSMCIVNV